MTGNGAVIDVAFADCPAVVEAGAATLLTLGGRGARLGGEVLWVVFCSIANATMRSSEGCNLPTGRSFVSHARASSS